MSCPLHCLQAEETITAAGGEVSALTAEALNKLFLEEMEQKEKVLALFNEFKLTNPPITEQYNATNRAYSLAACLEHYSKFPDLTIQTLIESWESLGFEAKKVARQFLFLCLPSPKIATLCYQKLKAVGNSSLRNENYEPLRGILVLAAPDLFLQLWKEQQEVIKTPQEIEKNKEVADAAYYFASYSRQPIEQLYDPEITVFSNMCPFLKNLPYPAEQMLQRYYKVLKINPKQDFGFWTLLGKEDPAALTAFFEANILNSTSQRKNMVRDCALYEKNFFFPFLKMIIEKPIPELMPFVKKTLLEKFKLGLHPEEKQLIALTAQYLQHHKKLFSAGELDKILAENKSTRFFCDFYRLIQEQTENKDPQKISNFLQRLAGDENFKDFRYNDYAPLFALLPPLSPQESRKIGGELMKSQKDTVCLEQMVFLGCYLKNLDMVNFFTTHSRSRKTNLFDSRYSTKKVFFNELLKFPPSLRTFSAYQAAVVRDTDTLCADFWRDCYLKKTSPAEVRMDIRKSLDENLRGINSPVIQDFLSVPNTAEHQKFLNFLYPILSKKYLSWSDKAGDNIAQRHFFPKIFENLVRLKAKVLFPDFDEQEVVQLFFEKRYD